MKKTFYFALLILAVLFYASCMKVTSEDVDNDLIDIETLNIPEDFIFDMHNNVNVQISVVDGALQPIEGIVVSVLTDYTNQALKGSTDDEGFFRGIASIPSIMNELTIKANNETVNLPVNGEELTYQFIVTGRTVTEQTVNITNSTSNQTITFDYYDPTATGQTLTKVEVEMYSTSNGGELQADNDDPLDIAIVLLHLGASYDLDDGGTNPRLFNESIVDIWSNNTEETHGPDTLAADNGDGAAVFDPTVPDGISFNGVSTNNTKSDSIGSIFESAYSNAAGGTFSYTLVKTAINQIDFIYGTADGQFTNVDLGGYIKLIYTDDGIPPDTDGDGVPNVDDDYPDDINRAYDNFYPASGYGCLVFEDKWPWKGDYDFNDLVVGYQFQTVTNAANEVVEVFADFEVRAAGSYYRNGFGFDLPDAIEALNTDLTVTGYNHTQGIITIDGITKLEYGQSHPTVIVFDDDETVIPSTGGNFVNTDEGYAYITPVSVTVTLTPPMPTWNAPGEYDMDDFSIDTFDPFLFIDRERGREVHLPGAEPTAVAALLNNYWFGHFDDNSFYGTNFVTTNNLPWVLNLPISFSYPKETSQITWAYLHFVEWAESGGTLYTDWYSNTGAGYRDPDYIYTAP
ncbi:MAG: LruC domain-containing protein [Armatimonadetes bacterium]|nr:LruC domain-containing protein [Armatimonadota bacterium]